MLPKNFVSIIFFFPILSLVSVFLEEIHLKAAHMESRFQVFDKSQGYTAMLKHMSARQAVKPASSTGIHLPMPPQVELPKVNEQIVPAENVVVATTANICEALHPILASMVEEMVNKHVTTHVVVVPDASTKDSITPTPIFGDSEELKAIEVCIDAMQKELVSVSHTVSDLQETVKLMNNQMYLQQQRIDKLEKTVVSLSGASHVQIQSLNEQAIQSTSDIGKMGRLVDDCIRHRLAVSDVISNLQHAVNDGIRERASINSSIGGLKSDIHGISLDLQLLSTRPSPSAGVSSSTPKASSSASSTSDLDTITIEEVNHACNRVERKLARELNALEALQSDVDDIKATVQSCKNQPDLHDGSGAEFIISRDSAISSADGIPLGSFRFNVEDVQKEVCLMIQFRNAKGEWQTVEQLVSVSFADMLVKENIGVENCCRQSGCSTTTIEETERGVLDDDGMTPLTEDEQLLHTQVLICDQHDTTASLIGSLKYAAEIVSASHQSFAASTEAATSDEGDEYGCKIPFMSGATQTPH